MLTRIDDAEMEKVVDAAAERIGPALKTVLHRIDAINGEIRSLSTLAAAHWRHYGQQAGEHAFLVAPIIRRIAALSEELAGLMAGLQIDVETKDWTVAA